MDRTAGGFFRLEIHPSGLLAAAGALACAGTVAGFFGRHHWLLDLGSHFRVQYIVVLLLFAIPLAVRRRFAASACCAVCAAINLALVAPLWIPETSPASGTTDSMRAMLINVNTEYRDSDLVIQEILEWEPDIIVLEEVSTEWLVRLRALAEQYPHSLAMPRDYDNFGIALLSKQPFEDGRIVYIGEVQVPSVFCKVSVDGRPVAILGTHAVPPGGPEYTRFRNDQIERLGPFAAGIDMPLLLLGDLNTSPWSWHFSNLLKQSGLHDSARGRGLQPTWPARIYPMLIPIDHCLHSDGLVILDRKVGGFIASDHYPLIVDFALKPSA